MSTMNSPAPVRLMLVDDHPLVRDGLRARLEAVPGFSVVAEAGDAQAALIEARRAAPDLVLMDIGMRGGNGIEATRRLLAELPAEAETMRESTLILDSLSWNATQKRFADPETRRPVIANLAVTEKASAVGSWSS